MQTIRLQGGLTLIGEQLKKLRKEKKWSQRKVAELIGISRGNYAHYETNSKVPREDNLQKLADLFDVSTDYLLGRTDEHKPVEQIKKDVQSSTPDILKVLENGTPHLNGQPLTDEQIEISIAFFEALLKKTREKKSRKQ